MTGCRTTGVALSPSTSISIVIKPSSFLPSQSATRTHSGIYTTGYPRSWGGVSGKCIRICLSIYSKADSRAFACKRRNLHCDAHVAVENKHTWPLKTNARDIRFDLSNLRLFLCLRSSNADKFTLAGCYDHYRNTDRKRRLFNFGKCTKVLTKGIVYDLFLAYQHSGQYYGVGPICPMTVQ